MPTHHVEPLRAPKMPPTTADGRRGRPFSVRLDDVERARLTELQGEAAKEIPWRPHRHRSLGAFVVWAALQWKPAQQELAIPANTVLTDSKGRVVGRRLGKFKFPKPRRRRRGTTRRPAGRRAPRKKGGRK